MCLLKPSELNNNNCAHEECKNFRMLNKPACIYSFNPVSKPANLFNVAPQSQNQPQLQQNGSDLLGPRNSSFLMNNSNHQSNEDFDDESSFVLNKKKLRVESTNSYGAEAKPAGIQTDLNGQPIMMNTQYSQFVANNGFEEKSLFNAPMLNNILLSNGSGVNKVNNNAQVMQMTQPIYLPYIPNQMGSVDPNMQNISYMVIVVAVVLCQNIWHKITGKSEKTPEDRF